MWDNLFRGVSRVVIQLLVVTFFSAPLLIPSVGNINNLILDRFVKVKGSDQIVLLTVDRKSAQRLDEGGAYYAQVLDALDELSPALVGIQPSLVAIDNSQQLTGSIENSRFPVVLTTQIYRESILGPSIEGVNVSSGFSNLSFDVDNKVRIFQRWINLGQKGCQVSFGSEIVTQFREEPDGLCGSDQSFVARYPQEEFAQFPITKLLDSQVARSEVEGKIVLIGLGSDLAQLQNVSIEDPFGRSVSELYIQAVGISSQLLGNYLIPLSRGYMFLLSLLLLSVSIPLIASLFNYRIKIFPIIVLFLILNGGALLALRYGLQVFLFDLNYLILLSVLYYFYLIFMSRRDDVIRMRTLFGQYVGDVLADRLSTSQEYAGAKVEKREMSVMFSDLRNFTSITESMDAEYVVTVLNDYLEVMSNVIIENGGVIDKFLGDGIMAFWNAPDQDPAHQYNSTVAALKMLEALDQFNSSHPQFPDLKLGIGINSGLMSVGSIGSKNRYDYTVIGDNVNLASRIENLTKKYGVDILLSDSVVEGLKGREKLDLQFRKVDRVRVKGRQSPLDIYEPIFPSGRKALTAEQYQAYDQALEHAIAGHFRRALRLFSQLSRVDPASAEMAKRIREILSDSKLKSEWDGVWTWDVK